jgi:restriction endonuclease Mrr
LKRDATMSIPRVQPLLLPVLRMTGDRNKHSVEEFWKRMIGNFKLSRKEVKPTHSKSDKNVFVNRVANALVGLVMRKFVVRKSPRAGSYRATKRGIAELKKKPRELYCEPLG